MSAPPIPSVLHPSLLIPIDLLEPDGDYTLTASHLYNDGLLLHTDLPTTPRQLLRLRVYTVEDPPPLILLATVKETLASDPTEGPLGTTASVMLHFYGMTPYTLTRWHRCLSWLDIQTQSQPTLPTPGDLDDDADAQHLRHLHKLLARGRAGGRRAYPRYALAWQARLVVDGDYLETHTENLSQGGVLLLVPDHITLSVGQVYELVLYHPDDGKHFHFKAAVARTANPQEPGFAALRFQPQDDDEAQEMKAFIESGIPPEERNDPLLLVEL